MNTSNGSHTSRTRLGESGASQGLLLGILALLVALFAYLYFFTGLIKERGAQDKPVTEPVQKVKQAMPPRPAGYDNRSAASAQQAKAPAPAAATAKPQPVPAVPPVAAKPKPQPSPAPAVAAKTPVPSPKPASEPQKSKPQPPPAAAKPVSPPAALPAKPAAKTVQPEKKVSSTAEPKQVPAKGKAESRFRISASSSPDKAAAVIAELKKRGLHKVERSDKAEEKTMKRLFVADFQDSQSAYSELDKVKKLSAGSFLVIESGKYILYAGSYDQQGRAEEELRRLSGQGLSVTLKKSKVRIPVVRITGLAPDRKRGDESINALKKLGVAAELKQVAN